MTSNEIYKRFLLKLNRNDSNEGINILKSHFIILFNTEAEKILIEGLNKEGDTIKLDAYDSFLEPDVELKKVGTKDNWIEFELPENFRRHASSFSIAHKGNCKGVKIYNFDKKPTMLTAVLADEFSNPSFDLEETPFIISHNKMRVFFKDFVIDKCFSTYYKAPDYIDIEGYTKFDGTPSANVDSNLPPDLIDSILNRMSADMRRQFQDAEGLSFDKDRINTEP